MAAWVNMLLLSSTGPIHTPVGACATAVESVDMGYETVSDSNNLRGSKQEKAYETFPTRRTHFFPGILLIRHLLISLNLFPLHL